MNNNSGCFEGWRLISYLQAPCKLLAFDAGR